MPIADYLKVCKKAAFERGFVWIMILLSRELDAIRSYNQLKQYWDSFDDLTGDKILFIMSVANQKERSYNNFFAHEIDRWRRLNNPNLLIVNQDAPTIPRWDFPSEMTIRKYQSMAIENNTHFISELCHEFNINEKDVPSFVLFSTSPCKEREPYIIPIKTDNLYLSIKEFIIGIQTELENFGRYRTKAREISLELKKVKSGIQQEVISNSERRYMVAKAKLLQVMKTGSEKINISTLQEAIEKGDIHACKQYPQPIRGYLNQIIDLQKVYPDIESNINQKHSHQQSIYEQEMELEKAQIENYDLLEKARRDLDSTIEGYISKNQKDPINKERRVNIHVPHFKIGITFSGKYRQQYIEPFCDELLHLGYTHDDIFYDSWHDALINGIHGDDILRQIYFKNCDFVVVLLSPDYKEKNWTGNIEWQAIKELINTGNDDKICLLRVDSADIGRIDGLYQNQAIAKSIDDMSPPEIATFIDCRYKMLFD